MAKRVFERVAEKIATKYGLEILRGYVLKRIEKVTPDDFYQAIKDGKHVWPLTSRVDKRRGKRWARKFAKYEDRLTPEIVLRWLSEDRPDLASVIIHMPKKTSIKWLATEINQIKHEVFK